VATFKPSSRARAPAALTSSGTFLPVATSKSISSSGLYTHFVRELPPLAQSNMTELVLAADLHRELDLF
jgi:hypothetical protein